MGFIKSELEKNKYKYIALEHIVLYVQSLDGENHSLSDTAKFLLRHYGDGDIPFGNIDDAVFRKNIADNYVQVNENRAFFHFLEFVIVFDNFEYGITESGFHMPNRFTELFVPIDAAKEFLTRDCGLSSGDLSAFICKLENKNQENNHMPAIETIEPKQQEQTAEYTELQAEITRLKSELAEYRLIQRHRERAPEFNALIETLLCYAKDYNSDKQPLKKHVALTFNEKAKLSKENRRGDEVARVLGLPEQNP